MGFWKNRPTATARLTIPAQLPIKVKQFEDFSCKTEDSLQLLQTIIKPSGPGLNSLENG
jgi:hypothetical protein